MQLDIVVFESYSAILAVELEFRLRQHLRPAFSLFHLAAIRNALLDERSRAFHREASALNNFTPQISNFKHHVLALRPSCDFLDALLQGDLHLLLRLFLSLGHFFLRRMLFLEELVGILAEEGELADEAIGIGDIAIFEADFFVVGTRVEDIFLLQGFLIASKD